MANLVLAGPPGSDAEDALSKQSIQNDILSEQLDALKQELEDVRGQLQSRTKESKELEVQIEKYKESEAKAWSMVDKMKAQRSKDQKTLQLWQEKFNEITEKLKNQVQANTKLAEKNKALKESIKDRSVLNQVSASRMNIAKDDGKEKSSIPGGDVGKQVQVRRDSSPNSSPKADIPSTLDVSSAAEASSPPSSPIVKREITDSQGGASSPIHVPDSYYIESMPPMETPSKRRRFDQEIDTDLITGKRRTIIPNHALVTPSTGGPKKDKDEASRRCMKAFLNGNSPHPRAVRTPTLERPIAGNNNKLADKQYEQDGDENDDGPSLEDIMSRDWHPNDFVPNKKRNGDLGYVYQETVRGKNRQCIHGTECSKCQAFYDIAGTGIEPAAPQWSTTGANPSEAKTVAKTSRHRDRWSKADTPPNFWQSDFPSTQQQQEDKKEFQKYRNELAMKRLYEALHDGQWMFRDPQLRQWAQKSTHTA